MVLPKKIILELALLFILLSLIGFIIIKYYRASKPLTPPPSAAEELSSEPSSSPPAGGLPSPKPSPKPIPHGKIEFSVSQGDKTKPQFSQGVIDPYDPAQGSRQTVTISAKDEQPITQLTAVLKTDNAVSKPVSLKLIDGSDTDGTWQGSWTVSDTYLYYHLVLTATSSRGSSKVDITLR